MNGNEIFKFKADNKSVTFTIQFCLGSISNGFSAIDSIEVYSNENVYDFSVDYKSFDKFDMLIIHKYLMTKMIENNVQPYQISVAGLDLLLLI